MGWEGIGPRDMSMDVSFSDGATTRVSPLIGYRAVIRHLLRRLRLCRRVQGITTNAEATVLSVRVFDNNITCKLPYKYLWLTYFQPIQIAKLFFQ